MSLTVLFFILLLPLGLAGEDIRISFFLGKSEYMKNGETDWKPIYKNLILNEKDSVRTLKNATLLLESAHKMKLKLSPETTVHFKELFPKTDISLNGGKVWAQVNKLKGDESFSIRSPVSVVGVRGTEFIYENSEDGDKVFVIHGRVAFGDDLLDENRYKEIDAGKIGFFKDREIELREPVNDDETNQLKSRFPILIEKKDFEKAQKEMERESFKNEVNQEIQLNQNTREYIKSKVNDDLTVGRTMTDSNGEIVQVQQVVRKLGNNSIQIINITKRPGFINIVEYKGTYNGSVPNTLKELIDIKNVNNKELVKEIYIVQKTGVMIDKLKIKEDKTDPNQKIFQIGSSTGSSEPVMENISSKTTLKQRDINPYLDAQYITQSGKIYNLKVYIMDQDRNIVSQTPGASNDLSLDFLVTMSLDFVFSGTGTSFDGRDIRFTVLPDVGFVIINEVVE